MEIDVRVEDPSNLASLTSLQTWLSNDSYVQKNAQPELRNSGSQRMANLAVIELVLTFGFKFAQLAFQIKKWLDESTSAAPLVVTPQGGSPTTIKRGDDELQILRGLVGASDPRNSSCVLIGISDYAGGLEELPPVKTNLSALRNVLLDPELWGIQPDKLKVVENPRSIDSIKAAIEQVSQNASDTLIVYYAGHGLLGQQNNLLLALPEASGEDERGTAPWADVAQTIDRLDYRRKIVWLDCCFAGLAAADNSVSENDAHSAGLRAAAKVPNTYILAAARETASSSSSSGCTAFTGELLKVLEKGVEPGRPIEEFLTMKSIHLEVTKALRARRLPEPSRDDPGRIGADPLFHNALEGAPLVPSPPVQSNPFRRLLLWLREHRTRGTVISAFLALIVAAAVVVYFAVPGSKVSGLDLAKYCSTLTPVGSQSLFVADSTCARPINLDAACAFSYDNQDVKSYLPTKDLNSAECVSSSNPALVYGGISNMGGYCQSITKAPEVTASPNNETFADQWACQVDIDLDLACDTQNNRGDLTSVEVGREAWDCHKAHLI